MYLQQKTEKTEKTEKTFSHGSKHKDIFYIIILCLSLFLPRFVIAIICRLYFSQIREKSLLNSAQNGVPRVSRLRQTSMRFLGRERVMSAVVSSTWMSVLNYIPF